MPTNTGQKGDVMELRRDRRIGDNLRALGD
jgi:hypothetical protein